MGYRSDVRIRLLLEDYEKLKKEYVEKFIDTHVTTWNMFSQDHLDYFRLEDTDDWTYDKPDNIDELNPSGKCVYFGWDCVKWYTNCDGFEDVTFVDMFAQSQEVFSFLRIGEDDEDVERNYSYFYSIGYKITIVDDDDDYSWEIRE